MPHIFLAMFLAKVSSLLALFAAGAFAARPEPRASGGYVQNTSGSASFTMYTGCGSPGEQTILRYKTLK
jgi:hypothetical protein